MPAILTPHEFTPEAYPAFPTDIPVVELETLSLQKLLAGDSAEEKRLFDACKHRGFFYLNLLDSKKGNTILEDATRIIRLGEQFMALPGDEKMKYALRQRELFGYKIAGAGRVDAAGTPETAEFLNISKDDMTSADSEMRRIWPEMVMNQKPLLARYTQTAHEIGMMIMDMLSRNLGIDPDEIRSRHAFDNKAGDHVRITRGPPRKTQDMAEIQTASHTDFGTITLLMNWLGGLQVWSSSSRENGAHEPEGPGQWLWVKPQENCAIVNLGDAAVKFTNGVLCAGRHRVVPSPGEQGKWPRYSVVYFVRPVDHCRLKTLKGSGIPAPDDPDEEGIEAKEWIYQRTLQLGIRTD